MRTFVRFETIGLSLLLIALGCTSATPQTSLLSSFSQYTFGRGTDGDVTVIASMSSGDSFSNGKRLVNLSRVIGTTNGRKLTMESSQFGSTDVLPGDEVMWHALAAYPETICGKDLEAGRYGFGIVKKTESAGGYISNITLDRPISPQPTTINAAAISASLSGHVDSICVLVLVRVHNFKNFKVQATGMNINLSSGSLDNGGGIIAVKVADTMTISADGGYVNFDAAGFGNTNGSFAGGVGGISNNNSGQRANGPNCGDAGQSGVAAGGGAGSNIGLGGNGIGGNNAISGETNFVVADDCPGCRKLFMGGSGAGGSYVPTFNGGNGGTGGGIIIISARKIDLIGPGMKKFSANGENGGSSGSSGSGGGGGGGGAGGTVFI
ncbi:MAG: hypothetical protein SGI74_03350, partial [Oligoflexia bacterium]|nr:hypothetical protein [Oligoflexia bacterium]